MKKKNLLMTAIAIFGLTTITSAQVPTYVPTNGLVGWWPFNGNANDESGNGNNGTVSGATLTSDRFGNSNKAYSFNGLNDFIQSDTISHLNLSVNSISTWIYAPSFSDHHQIEYSAPTFGTLGRAFAFNISRLAIVPTSNCVDASGPGVINLSGQLGINSWYNLVFVSDGSIGKFYINGVYISQANIGSSICQNPLALTLSRGTNGGGPTWYTGKIDDIGIWNRALTQQEITDLYNGCQLSVNTQPTNQTININNNAQFVVGSSDPGATYQWQTDLGVGFQNLNSVGQYSGTTDDTLSVSNVTMSNNNQPFRCIISSGSCSDTSNVAVLTVNNNVGINETLQDNLFSVFPNPAQSVINVKADSKLIGSVYSIYDNTGRVVLSGKLNAESTTIELGNLSGRIYIFSVGENLKQTFKVIKE
jgi:hypothetical protein